MPEIRFEAPDESVGVLDAYCAAGSDRTKVMLALLFFVTIGRLVGMAQGDGE